MPSSDMYGIAEMPSPSGLGAYRQEMAIGHLEDIAARGSKGVYVTRFIHGSLGGVSDLQLMASMRATRLANAYEHWRRQVMDPGAPTDVDALTATVAAGLDLVAEFGPDSLSLAGLRPDDVQCEHLAALLRATSTWRDSIVGWHEALDVAKASVAGAGLDPDDVLFGMV